MTSVCNFKIQPVPNIEQLTYKLNSGWHVRLVNMKRRSDDYDFLV